jgi:hypothetical protein
MRHVSIGPNGNTRKQCRQQGRDRQVEERRTDGDQAAAHRFDDERIKRADQHDPRDDGEAEIVPHQHALTAHGCEAAG